MSTVFFKERDVAQAVSICRALSKRPPDRYGHAPDTDAVQDKFPDYHPTAWKLAYDARSEAVQRIWKRDQVSIYWRDQASDHLAARLLKDGWLPHWYLRAYDELSKTPDCVGPRILIRGLAVDQKTGEPVCCVGEDPGAHACLDCPRYR